MAAYLITGASRGLGLAMAAELAASPESEVSVIFATSRQPNPPAVIDLVDKTSGKVVPVYLDPNDPQSLQSAVEQVERRLQGRGLDGLVNNAGIMPMTAGMIENMENLTDVLHTNVTLSHLVTRAFMPLLRKGNGKTIVNITSTLGSIGRAPTAIMHPAHAYKISKAAMNMMTVLYAHEYAEEGFSIFAVNPGWLRTDMGGENADLPVETGAQEVVKYLKHDGQELNGRFLNIHIPGWENAPGHNQYDGKDPVW
ncbi:hypothetical protein BDW62DRAFT_216142 [Aspergillus aurantiobrunneus]